MIYHMNDHLKLLYNIYFRLTCTCKAGIIEVQNMILNFADKETEKIYNQEFSKKLPQSIQRIALRKLIMINNAACLP